MNDTARNASAGYTQRCWADIFLTVEPGQRGNLPNLLVESKGSALLGRGTGPKPGVRQSIGSGPRMPQDDRGQAGEEGAEQGEDPEDQVAIALPLVRGVNSSRMRGAVASGSN